MSFPGFLITGTDTEIGKTFTGATLTLAFTALGRRVTPIKALAAGQEPVDGRWVNEDVGIWSIDGKIMPLTAAGSTRTSPRCMRCSAWG